MGVLTELANKFGQSPSDVYQHTDGVYRLDKPMQERTLHSAQRIADIFSHIASDRNELCGRLQAIAALTDI
jgi:hypothetical protein